MKRLLPRVPLTVAIGCSLTFPLAAIAQQAPPAAPAPAAAGGAAPAATAGAAPAQVDEALQQDVEDFWHYAKIGRYDLATAQAEKVLQRRDRAGEVLRAFETVSRDRKDNLDQWMLRWQGVGAIKEPVTQLITVLNEGRFGRRSEIPNIEENIKRLSTNERAYELAIARLRESGELAVPIMVDYLRDSSKREYQSAVRRALRDLGREALNPLLAATEMRDAATLVVVVDALGDIGYDATVPYLLRLVQDRNAPDAVRAAARDSLVRMGHADPRSMNAAEAFYDLGEKFYYNTAAVQADPRQPVAYVWSWDENRGLTKKDVPSPIFEELMAMRACEYSLRIDPEMGRSLSLWLASNYKREVELPQGAADPTRQQNQPDAHYYGVTAGARYVNDVLARALRDHNTPVALKAVRSLGLIAGNSNVFQGTTEQGQALVDALNYPDRQVRFEAAYAIGSAIPQKDFAGQERVVPILGEALSQSGKPNVLVILPSQDDVNKIAETFKGQYTVAGATTVDAGLAEAQRLQSVDVVLTSDSLPPGDVDHLLDVSSKLPQLQSAAKVIVTKTRASRYAARTINNPMLSLTQVRTPEDLGPSLEAGRKKAGALGLDDKAANDFAMRSAELLARLALSRTQVLDLSAAEGSLLSQLDDSRTDLVKACGRVLGSLNSKNAQNGLLAKATDEKTPDDVKISLLNSLSTNAKFYGNLLSQESLATLQKVVEGAQNLEVRSAAAEVRGSLNLPADQARTLILNQSKV